jgi:hypothetical protein
LEGGRVDVPLDKCEALFVIRHLPS